jgi:hypothetical protein
VVTPVVLDDQLVFRIAEVESPTPLCHSQGAR